MLNCKLTKLFGRKDSSKNPNIVSGFSVKGLTSVVFINAAGDLDSRALNSITELQPGCRLLVNGLSGYIATSNVVGVASDDYTVCVGTLTQKEIMCLSTIDTTKEHRIVITNNSVYLLEVLNGKE